MIAVWLARGGARGLALTVRQGISLKESEHFRKGIKYLPGYNNMSPVDKTHMNHTGDHTGSVDFDTLPNSIGSPKISVLNFNLRKFHTELQLHEP